MKKAVTKLNPAVIFDLLLAAWVIYQSVEKPDYPSTWSTAQLTIVGLGPILVLSILAAFFHGRSVTPLNRRILLTILIAAGLGIAGYILLVTLTLQIHGLYGY